MSFIADIFAEKRSTAYDLSTSAGFIAAATAAASTSSGASVNQTSAMSLTAVYAAVKLIAWTMASLPLHVYRRGASGRSRATEEEIYRLLHDSPNSEMTSFAWRSFMFVQQNLFGAGISEIEYNRNGEIVALWPLPTAVVTPKRTAENKELIYEINIDGQTSYLWPWQVLVFPALQTSLDAWLSPIAQHRESIGAALAVKDFGAKTFGQGVNPSGILSGLKFPNEVSEQSIKEKFSDAYSGLSNSHRLMLLEDGTKFERIALPPEDAQYLETMRFNIGEIARIFNVPLHLMQEVSGSTSWGSGIEELNIGFVTYCLRPYAVLWEQEIKKKLLADNSELFAEYNFDGLLRGKLSERVAAYATARQWGWMSVNDIREIENMNSVEAGDTYLVPMNMIDARDLGKQPAATAPAAEEPADAEDIDEEENNNGK